jgi:hypothetical protein
MSNAAPTGNESVDKSILLEVYRAQWADIHHNRNQDWEISKFILAGILAVSGLKAFSTAVLLTTIVALGFAVICALGVIITFRHKRLFYEKMAAVFVLERQMGIDKLNLFPQPTKLRRLRTQDILIVTYIFWAILFVVFAIVQRGI